MLVMMGHYAPMDETTPQSFCCHLCLVAYSGKGSFYATDLDCILKARNIQTLLVCGVTTEVCVHTTIREANDRGYYCICIGDCCASYFDDFHKVALQMIIAQNGIFGSLIENSNTLIDAMKLKSNKINSSSK